MNTGLPWVPGQLHLRIHIGVDELAASGIGLILISSEMPELIGLADRVLVMAGGRITAELKRPDINEAAILKHAMPQSAAQNGEPIQ